MTDIDPPSTIEPIPREECVRLLATQEVGRLAVVDGDQPLIFPVNYAVDGDHVVIHTAERTKLDFSRLRHVAFEFDHIEAGSRTGWSVGVQGLAHEGRLISLGRPGPSTSPIHGAGRLGRRRRRGVGLDMGAPSTPPTACAGGPKCRSSRPAPASGGGRVAGDGWGRGAFRGAN